MTNLAAIGPRTTYATKLLILPDTLGTRCPAAQVAASRISDSARSKQGMILGTATGRTMVDVYNEVAVLAVTGQLEPHQIGGFFGLDEYVRKQFALTYLAFMNTHLYGPLGIAPTDSRIHLPKWDTGDAETECIRYEAEIRLSDGVDLQLLGIGRNGHAAFNEPGTPFDSVTHVVELTQSTRIANSPEDMTDDEKNILGLRGNEDPTPLIDGWGEAQRDLFFQVILPRVPAFAMTQGIATILSARSLLMLVTGAKKREALFDTLLKAPSLNVPASLMRFHPDFTIIADESAAATLPRSIGKNVGELQLISG